MKSLYLIEFPQYPGEGTSTFAEDADEARRIVRPDVERRLGKMPKDVVVTFIKREGT